LEHSAFHTGHLNPFMALARRPPQRGHRVIIFGIADTEARVRAAGVEFQRVGCEDYPLGTLKQLDDKLSRLKGLEMFRFTVERVRNHSSMVLRDGPSAVKATGVETLLVDEADMGGVLEVASDVIEKSLGLGLSSAANMSLETALNRPV
jgi:UDP:flavonoid glycosyltransferase YjiC (YdhE family)